MILEHLSSVESDNLSNRQEIIAFRITFCLCLIWIHKFSSTCTKLLELSAVRSLIIIVTSISNNQGLVLLSLQRCTPRVWIYPLLSSTESVCVRRKRIFLFSSSETARHYRICNLDTCMESTWTVCRLLLFERFK